jgi:RNA polymerase sigma-70 factor, ECF subfamily
MKRETPGAVATSQLIKRAQQGDADAFAAIFDAHKARVYSLCLGMTNNTAEAEDLTQDAFMQVFRKLCTFRGDSAFSTWLYRVAFNTVLMHFRRRSFKEFSLDEPVCNGKDDKPIRREFGTQDLNLTGSVDRIALTRAIRDLPEGYRTVFLLHEVEGFEHQEIADLLGCSSGNSKSQLHKAKLKIRELLGHSGKATATKVRVSAGRAKAERISAQRAALPRDWKETSVPGEAMPQPASLDPAISGFAASA